MQHSHFNTVCPPHRPHRLKPVDCKFISKLAKSVPVIPVLAKADSMTTKELDSFRRTVRETLVKVPGSVGGEWGGRGDCRGGRELQITRMGWGFRKLMAAAEEEMPCVLN